MKNIKNKKIISIFVFILLLSTGIYAAVSVVDSNAYKWNPVNNWVQEGKVMLSGSTSDDDDDNDIDTSAGGFKQSFGFLRAENLKLSGVEKKHTEEINKELTVLGKNIDQLRAQLGPQCTFGIDDNTNCQTFLPYPCKCDKTGCQTCMKITDKGITSRLKYICHNVEGFESKTKEEILKLQEEWEKDFKEKTCDDEGVQCGPPGYCHLGAPYECQVDGGIHVCIPGFEDVESLRDVVAGFSGSHTMDTNSEELKNDINNLDTISNINKITTYQQQQDLYNKLKNQNQENMSSYTRCFIKTVEAQKDQGCGYKYIQDPSSTLDWMGGGESEGWADSGGSSW